MPRHLFCEGPACGCGRASQASALPRRLGRRGLLATAAGTLAALSLPAAPRAAGTVPQTSMTASQVLALLKQGNDSFRADAPYSYAHARGDRLRLADGQAPFCVVVGCSDSRVPPELLFGRGLGELFIVRNAGNTVDTAALGSIEYGVGILGCPLIVVLGHENCGAVSAALDVVARNATFPGVIGEMVQPIIPAVLSLRRDGALPSLDAAVEANARRVATRLKTQSQVLQGALQSGHLQIVAARYSLHDGDVTWFEDI